MEEFEVVMRDEEEGEGDVNGGGDWSSYMFGQLMYVSRNSSSSSSR